MHPTKAVLFVDDDPRWLFAVGSFVAARFPGLTVLRAESGPQALELLSTRADIRLVMLDLLMPVMNGFDVLRTWKKRSPRSTIPFVAVTTDVFPATQQACLEAGFVQYVPKPLEPEQMLGILELWLNDSGKIPVLGERSAQAPQSP